MSQDETATPKTRIDLATKPNFSRSGIQQVEVVNVDISFLNLLILLIKLAIAAIPAAIIVGLIWTIVGGLIFGLMSSPF